MAIHFFATAVLLLSRTYTDQLFLSTYPRSWLPYLFLGQTTVMLGISFAASPLLAGGSVRSNSLVTGGLIASLLLSGAGLFFHVPGAPFVVSLWLYVVAAVITMVAWNVVGDTFEMRQYKKLVKWISAAGNVGAVGSGAAIPLMVAALGGNSLLYIMAGMMTVCVACYPLVPPLPSAPAAVKKKAAASPLRYPLVQQLALTALIMMLVYTVVDYLFKAQVATAYQGDSAAIGSFMGPFYSINQLALMIVQISVPDTLLRSFGINGLLAPMPLLSIAIGGAAILLPGLWPMVISRAFHGVIRYGLDNMGREIALRPLPSAIRNAGKLHVKINASSVGAAIASLLLMVAATRVSNLGIGAAMIGISAVWLYYTLKGTRSYHRTLQEAVGNGRLSVSEDDQGEGARRGGKAVAEFALQSDDEETILFGLGFLEQAEGGAIPPLLIPHLAGGTPEIRIAAARAARGFTPETAAPALVQRLE